MERVLLSALAGPVLAVPVLGVAAMGAPFLGLSGLAASGIVGYSLGGALPYTAGVVDSVSIVSKFVRMLGSDCEE